MQSAVDRVLGIVAFRIRDSMGWDLYRAMNERFADVIAPRLAPGDRIESIDITES